MKQLMILTIITYTFCSLAFAEVADYYFPGEVGSQWTFDIPGMPDVIYTRKTDLQLSGRTYHIVSETFPLLGGLSNDPFLAFRISQNQVLGFAKKANQMLADAFIQGLKEGGGGIIEGKIRFDSGDEWVLLNQEPEPGNEWNFAKWTVTIWDKRNPGNKIKGVILYRAAVKKRENIGRFQAMKIDYEMTAEFPKMQKLQEEMLTLWISRRVGIVQIGIPGQKTKACLTKYNIVSIKEAVKMTSDRLIATDNAKDAKVILNFTDALGNTWTKEAPEAVTIDTEIIIREANFDKVYVKNGEKVTLTVVTEPGATVTADVSDLHTDQTEAILLTETETPGTFDVDIKVNEENTAENGKRAIHYHGLIKISKEHINKLMKYMYTKDNKIYYRHNTFYNKYGASNFIEIYNKAEFTAYYMSKYIGKQFYAMINDQYYFASKSLKKSHIIFETDKFKIDKEPTYSGQFTSKWKLTREELQGLMLDNKVSINY